MAITEVKYKEIHSLFVRLSKWKISQLLIYTILRILFVTWELQNVVKKLIDISLNFKDRNTQRHIHKHKSKDSCSISDIEIRSIFIPIFFICTNISVFDIRSHSVFCLIYTANMVVIVEQSTLKWLSIPRE